MNKFFLFCSLLMLSDNGYAGKVSNSEMVELYKTQKPYAQDVFNQTQNLMIESQSLYEKMQGGNATTSMQAVYNKKLIALLDASKRTLGEPLTKTPFRACRDMPLALDGYWLQKQYSLRSSDQSQLVAAAKNYLKVGGACKSEIANAPPSETEELSIINLDN